MRFKNKSKLNIADTTKPERWTESWKRILLILTPPEALSSAPKNTETYKTYII
jgi:hypothetical protein